MAKRGKVFERINLACPRATLEKAMERLEGAVRARESVPPFSVGREPLRTER